VTLFSIWDRGTAELLGFFFDGAMVSEKGLDDQRKTMKGRNKVRVI
jgi:hypothetical protein